MGGKVVPGGIGPETRAVPENIKSCLKIAGASMADIVKTTVWLRDRSDFPAFNVVHAEYFPHQPPARSTVESRLMICIAVEIEAIAYAPASGPPQTVTGNPTTRAFSCRATKRE